MHQTGFKDINLNPLHTSDVIFYRHTGANTSFDKHHSQGSKFRLMDWSTFLRIAHILGTALGVGGTTLMEIYSIKFLKDKKVDAFEHDVIKVCISAVRIGLIILTFSGLGLLVLWRLKMLGPEVFFAPRFLAKMTIVLVLLTAALLINFRLVNLKIGGAVSTASWYAAMILGMWRKVPLSYFSIMLSYIAFIVLTYLILEYFRRKNAKT